LPTILGEALKEIQLAREWYACEWSGGGTEALEWAQHFIEKALKVSKQKGKK
jgi:hypothetical protein